MTADTSSATAPLQDDLRGVRILLADDDPMVRRLTRNMLSRMGCEVIEACDGCEALECINGMEGNPVDLLLTDVLMPRMDGKVLAEAVHSRFPQIKILMTSGYAEPLDGICPEPSKFIQKPFTAKLLREKLCSLLAGDR